MSSEHESSKRESSKHVRSAREPDPAPDGQPVRGLAKAAESAADVGKGKEQRPQAQSTGSALSSADAKIFLPDPEKAEADNDREALNLLSQHYLAIYAKEKKAIHLERAWKVTQAVLAVGEVDSEQKEEALKRAVELAPKVREELGQTWLEDSFTKRPERGMEIIAATQNAAQIPMAATTRPGVIGSISIGNPRPVILQPMQLRADFKHLGDHVRSKHIGRRAIRRHPACSKQDQAVGKHARQIEVMRDRDH